MVVDGRAVFTEKDLTVSFEVIACLVVDDLIAELFTIANLGRSTLFLRRPEDVSLTDAVSNDKT